MAATVDLEGEQRGRGAEQRIRRERGAEQRTGERGEEPRSRGEMSGGGMSGGERERSSTGGDWDKPRQEGEGHMGRLVGWASPLLTLPFFFFFPFLFSSSTTLSCCFKFFLNP